MMREVIDKPGDAGTALEPRKSDLVQRNNSQTCECYFHRLAMKNRDSGQGHCE
jgi:hypothetical protein